MRQFYLNNYFLIKRLHSLLGVIPVGVFFLVHMLLNSRAAQSADAYQWVPNTLDQIPYVWAVELFGIILPFAFHGLLGLVIVWQGAPNSYERGMGWYSNWAYLLQRYTGVALFVMIAWHLWQTWWQHWAIKFSNFFQRSTIPAEFDIYGVMNGIVSKPFWLIFYALFVIFAAWHFGNGLYNFFYKWGATTSKPSQRWTIAAGMAVALVGIWMGFVSLWGLSLSPWARDLAASLSSWVALH